MKRLVISAVALAAIAMFLGTRTKSAGAAESGPITVIATSPTCDCCPNVTANVTVNPQTGVWSVNMTEPDPVTGQPVPATYNPGSTATERSATTNQNPPANPQTTTTATQPAAGYNETPAGGQMNGRSPAIPLGEASDQNDQCQSNGDGQQDTDVRTYIEITFTKSCPPGPGCGSGLCTYVLKFTVVSDEGFSVVQTV